MTTNGLFSGVNAAASGMSAERLRMTVATENLAHAGDTKRLANGLPYARQRVTFQNLLDDHGQETGLVTAKVITSPAYERRIDPTHPDADKDGVVHTPDISPILEMVDLLTASKAYEANANAARGLMRMNESALRIAPE